MGESSKIGIIILAAGASKRLGQPKQLVSFQGKKLLQHTIDCTVNLDFSSKVLVLGAKADQVLQQVELHDFNTCLNKQWEEGMGSSLRIAVEKSIELNPDLEAIIVQVSDQPFVSKELLGELLELYISESSIVACEYEEVKGVPTLFGSKYFDELLQLDGDQGAKKIIQKHQSVLKIVRFDQGNFDIDTPEDLERLKSFE
ncbi:nucleotidyltransferase family protein [Ekhidna sp. To15]|uniref:nucleotidyltransferase family protein n=1 Tax=Ekhidna sp. To15 TaxID=3395267 RepID=UPI003F526222